MCKMMLTIEEMANLILPNTNERKFALAYYADGYAIRPKVVDVRRDHTVWFDGACIINGMKDKLFIAIEYNGADYLKIVKDEFESLLKADTSLTKEQFKNLKDGKPKKRL